MNKIKKKIKFSFTLVKGGTSIKVTSKRVIKKI